MNKTHQKGLLNRIICMKHLLLTTIVAVLVVGCGTSIYEAAEEGQIEEVKKLLAAGAGVNAQTKFKETPLHFAAENGQKEAADLLIDKGANIMYGICLQEEGTYFYNRSKMFKCAKSILSANTKYAAELKMASCLNKD